MAIIPQEVIDKIRSDFPEESVQVKEGFKDAKTGKRKVLTGYKPQYIIERLNDCFGHDGWDFEILEFGREDNDAWVKGQLTTYMCKFDANAIDGPLIRKVMSIKQQFGTSKYNKGTEMGDVYKSASTNALEKCASLFDVGHKAYKGLLKVPDEHPEKEGSDKTTAKNDLLVECKKCEVTTTCRYTCKDLYQ